MAPRALHGSRPLRLSGSAYCFYRPVVAPACAAREGQALASSQRLLQFNVHRQVAPPALYHEAPYHRGPLRLRQLDPAAGTSYRPLRTFGVG